jgi:hypothetical protein
VCGLLNTSIFPVFERYINDFDVVYLSQTKTDSIPDDEFSDFHTFCIPKNKRTHGISILVRKEFSDFVTTVKGIVSNCVFGYILVRKRLERML